MFYIEGFYKGLVATESSKVYSVIPRLMEPMSTRSVDALRQILSTPNLVNWASENPSIADRPQFVMSILEFAEVVGSFIEQAQVRPLKKSFATLLRAVSSEQWAMLMYHLLETGHTGTASKIFKATVFQHMIPKSFLVVVFTKIMSSPRLRPQVVESLVKYPLVSYWSGKQLTTAVNYLMDTKHDSYMPLLRDPQAMARISKEDLNQMVQKWMERGLHGERTTMFLLSPQVINRVDPTDFGNYFFRLLDEGKESSAADIMAQPLVLARIPNPRRMGIYSILLRNKNPSDGFMMSITNEHMIKWIPGEVWGVFLIRYLELEIKQALWLLQNPAIIQRIPEESIEMISRHLKDFPLADPELLEALVAGPLRFKFSSDTWMTIILKYLFLGNTKSAAFLLGQQDLVARFPEGFKLRLLILKMMATHGHPALEIKSDALRLLEDIAATRRQVKPSLEPRPLQVRPDLPKLRRPPRPKPEASFKTLQPAVRRHILPRPVRKIPSGMSSFSGQVIKGLSHL